MTWPVTVGWMSPDDEAEMDAKWGGTVNGYRAASNTRAHRIVLRAGNTADQTAGTIRHQWCIAVRSRNWDPV